MAKLTDGKRIATITMKTWDGSSWGPDWSDDFFAVGGLEYDEDLNAYKVEDVLYCIEQANDWEFSDGDFSDDETPADDKSVWVEVEKYITAENHGEFYWWIDTDYHYGDFSEPKFALFCVDKKLDNIMLINTEELILWAAYDDVCDSESDDWKPIDEYIAKQLGFLPDYDIN